MDYLTNFSFFAVHGHFLSFVTQPSPPEEDEKRKRVAKPLTLAIFKLILRSNSC